MSAQPPPSADIIRQAREISDTTLLAFSCGKDAIASWVAIRPHFRRVVPYYMYLVPDLEFVEDSIQYYERHFGERILRVPHPSLYRMLGALVFQPPERRAAITAARLPQFDYADVCQAIREDYDAEGAYVAEGVRACDSIVRRASIVRFGAIRAKSMKFYPVWDWNKQAVVDAIQREGVRLPVDYEIFGRSFDGIDYRFLKPIKDRFPRDYQRILEWFPMADIEIARREYALQ
jgi:hypothetical protein